MTLIPTGNGPAVLFLALATLAFGGATAAIARVEADERAALSSRRGRSLNTVIVSGPGERIHLGAGVAFSFSSNQARSRFQCRLDSAGWRACKSPSRFADLGVGGHRFSVRARAGRGLYDRSPAISAFEVVASPLDRQRPPTLVPGAVPAPAGPEDAEVLPSLFAADSVWTTPLAATTPIDPASPQMIGVLLDRIDAEQRAGGGPSLSIWGRTSLYRVGPEQPRVSVFLDTGPWGDLLAARFEAGVPIPPGAQPVKGQDRSMAVWQPSTDSYWEFFHLEQNLHAPQFARSPTVSGGCFLLGGTYAYKLTTLNDDGETSAGTPPLKVQVPLGACVTIYWSPINGATGYRIYRGLNGAGLSQLTTVAGDRVSFLDDGSLVGDGTTPPVVNAATTPGEWHATFGGFISAASQSPGYYQDVKDLAGNTVQQSSWGAAATGLPLAGGLITKEDVERGRIDHALSLGLANGSADSILRAGTFAFPAQRSDGRSQDPSSIPEGARLILDPELEIDSLGLSPFAHMLAEAAQRFGMIVHDGSQGTAIYAEDPSPYVAAGGDNFYQPLIASNSTKAMRGFPWDELEVARMRLCTARPCAEEAP
jgi:hypothetical protein